MMKKIIIGITGASGSIYGKRMVEVLLENQIFVILIATENGKKVFSYELDLDFDLWSNGLKEKYENFTEEDIDNLFAGAASGSYDFDGVITVSYTHLRAHETRHDLVCRLLLEKK